MQCILHAESALLVSFTARGPSIGGDGEREFGLGLGFALAFNRITRVYESGDNLRRVCAGQRGGISSMENCSREIHLAICKCAGHLNASP